MSYQDSICAALNNQNSDDLPSELWGNTISNQAALMAGYEAGHVASVWD